MTDLASKLRTAATTGDWLPIEAKHGPMLADALELADEYAWIDIDSNTSTEEIGGVKWWDTQHFDRYMTAAEVTQRVRYLDARDLIEHHPERPELVRLKEGG